MKTNYQKLDTFETCAVVLASIGVFLFGIISYNGLNEKHQRAVTSAFEMFDLHEEAIEQKDAFYAMLFTMPQGALQEFYLAFSEIMVVTDESYSWWQTFGQQSQIAFTQTLEFSEKVAISFQNISVENNSFLLPELGRVAGVSVSVESPPEEGEALENILPTPPPGFKPPADPRSIRGYIPPQIPDKIKHLIKP